jgi:hypothetical protein
MARTPTATLPIATIPLAIFGRIVTGSMPMHVNERPAANGRWRGVGVAVAETVAGHRMATRCPTWRKRGTSLGAVLATQS